jgi:hypothetical protein
MLRIRRKRAYDRVYHNAAISGPIDIIVAIDISAVLGWFFTLGLLFSIQDYETTVTSPMGQPVTQVILDTAGKRV